MTATLSTPKPVGIRKFLLLWPLFFLICGGLGYPSLRRFDPRVTGGLSDTIKYYAITTGEDQSGFREIMRCRVLVPYIARPFYWFAQSHLPAWNPVFFGLLVSASIFCATTACFIVSLGVKVFGDLSLGLLGALLYLLNFAVSNFLLAGMVDAGEACFMAAVTWSLINDKWRLLPLWGLVGAAAKETFVPFAGMFALAWWFIEYRRNKVRSGAFIWVIALAFVGLGGALGIRAAVVGQFRWPWQFAEQVKTEVGFFAALRRCFTQSSFWYVFGWLLPLGMIRLKTFPKSWVVAAAVTSILALTLGVYIDSGGNFGRAVFNISGPLLNLSVAALISGKRPSLQPNS
ncbi:MAG TPA: hypothetical protein VN951_16425 [Pyrinomonadaceae bacterium]|nr:hypothetical protein [Pyrinomonadaceae bacterium]